MFDALEPAGRTSLWSTGHLPINRFPWKSPCLADHRARSGHSYRDATHTADLQLFTGPQSYEVSPSPPIVRSRTSNAPTACILVPSPAPSGDGHTQANAHIETQPPTTDTTTRTSAATITTSELCWNGPRGPSDPGPDESCGGNSRLSTNKSSPAQSTTRSRRETSHGGSDGSRSDAQGVMRITSRAAECNTDGNERREPVECVPAVQ